MNHSVNGNSNRFDQVLWKASRLSRELSSAEQSCVKVGYCQESINEDFGNHLCTLLRVLKSQSVKTEGQTSIQSFFQDKLSLSNIVEITLS